MFYKICKSESPQYLFKLIPEKMSSYVTRNFDNIPLFNIRYNFCKNSFCRFFFVNLGSNLRSSENFGFSRIIFLNLLDPNQLAILRILTGKKHPKIKLQRLRETRIWTLGSLVHQVNSF